MTGAELIAAERERQVQAEGWTAEHDRSHHQDNELALAAVCYALPAEARTLDSGEHSSFRVRIALRHLLWPWTEGWWKPSPDDRVRELVKAGALLAAEIDRLQAAPAA